MLAPPSLDGAVQDNEACVLPAVALNPVGALGTPRTVVLAELVYALVPPALIVATLK